MIDHPKLHIGGVDPEQEVCLRCGSRGLDTGWECTECGYDNMPHYVGADQQAKPEVK